ncbi:MAG: hypothetical protein C0598_12355 [Marinilabiliales bacterium]|nr:MAG: hypothetical protein C0598_12355 [Marinilabiliales bacterium]
MRKQLYILILLISVLLPELKAQDIPPPNPSMVISILSGYSVTFMFDDISEYKNGILNGGQATFIRIGAVMDWKLQFNADQSIFYGESNPSNQMELNNVGVVVTSTGTNLDDGSNIINYAKVSPIALSSSEITLMDKGSLSNRGYENRNSFTLNWEMGTKRGNMNNESILQQMIEADTYMVNIILTLSPSIN